MPADDGALARWIAQLSDPRRRLQMPVFGRLRSRTWGYEERRLPEHLVHFVLSGGHAGHVDGIPVRTRAESVLWVPPGVRQRIHAATGPQPFGIYYLRFTLAGSAPPRGGPYVRDGMGHAYPLFVRLVQECGSDLAGREDCLRALLVLVFSEWRRASDARQLRLNERQCALLIEMAGREASRRLHPRALAEAVGLSPDRFGRRFLRTFGSSPRTWLMQQRVRHAAQRLLEARGQIGEVAAAFGYPNLFLFSRQLKAVLGVGPRRWRQMHGVNNL
jgi:AraC-like DNA-binding protein